MKSFRTEIPNSWLLIIGALCLVCGLFGCNIKEQKAAKADAQAMNIEYLYDKKSGLCFGSSGNTGTSNGYTYIPCDVIPKELIPNYPQNIPPKTTEKSCRFEAVLKHQNTSLI